MIATPPAPDDAPLSLMRLLRFHAPLAGQAVLMTLSGPLLCLIVARAADPRLELAAFWLGFTLALFAQSLCLALQQSTVAVVRARGPLRAMVLSALGVGALATLAVLAVALTPIGDLLFMHVVPATSRTSALARDVLRILAPLPLLIALRSVASGVAVGGERTSLVALTTATRLLVLLTALALVMASGQIAGAIPAAWAVVAGVTAETAFIVIGTFRQGRPAWQNGPSEQGNAAYAGLLRVTAPLAVAALVWTATRPLLHALLGRLSDPERAQAGFGVVLPWLILAGAPAWALLETNVVLAKNPAAAARVRGFAVLVAVSTALGIAILVSPLVRGFWMRPMLSADPLLGQAVEPALPWLVLAPLLVAMRALAQGRLIREQQTTVLFALAPLRFAFMACMGTIATQADPHAAGPTLAVMLVLGGDALDAITYTLAARGMGRRTHDRPTSTEILAPADPHRRAA